MNYPRLAEMGVQNPEHIARYSVNSINFVDYLRIVYERPSGSLLPVSRVYRFPRVQKSADVDNDGKPETVMTSSPELVAVLEELKEIVEATESRQDIAAIMLDELRCLEEDVASHGENLRSLINQLQKP